MPKSRDPFDRFDRVFDKVERNIGKLIALYVFLFLAFWGAVAFILLHFVFKAW